MSRCEKKSWTVRGRAGLELVKKNVLKEERVSEKKPIRAVKQSQMQKPGTAHGGGKKKGRGPKGERRNHNLRLGGEVSSKGEIGKEFLHIKG